MEFHESCWIIPIYFDKNKKIFYVLLVKWRHNHRWFPKGHVEKWEDCKTTALREFEEETNIPENLVKILDNLKFEDKYYFKLNNNLVFKKVTYYLGVLKDNFQDYIKPQQGEIDEIKLFTLDEAKQILEFKSLQKIIDKVSTLLSNNDISFIQK